MIDRGLVPEARAVIDRRLKWRRARLERRNGQLNGARLPKNGGTGYKSVSISINYARARRNDDRHHRRNGGPAQRATGRCDALRHRFAYATGRFNRPPIKNTSESRLRLKWDEEIAMKRRMPERRTNSRGLFTVGTAREQRKSASRDWTEPGASGCVDAIIYCAHLNKVSGRPRRLAAGEAQYECATLARGARAVKIYD